MAHRRSPWLAEAIIARVSPDLNKLAHFVAVAEELNFTRAADRLHMSQQALSAYQLRDTA